jgi:hypothetical protein
MEGAKQCTKCQCVKPLADFTKHVHGPGGFNWWCRLCTNTVNKQWRVANPEKQRYEGSWQHRNPEWRRKNLSDKYRALKQKVLRAYGSRCATCGFEDERALQLDHVHENGAEDRRKRTPLQRLQQIVADNYPDDYQILCANCNTIKACERGTLRFTSTETCNGET